jgi:hypothetical protein
MSNSAFGATRHVRLTIGRKIKRKWQNLRELLSHRFSRFHVILWPTQYGEATYGEGVPKLVCHAPGM